MRTRFPAAGGRGRALGASAALIAIAAAVGSPVNAAPSASASTSASAQARCAVPTNLSIRPVDPTTVRLVWTLPASLRGASVRVYRAGGVVGQTRARSMIVRVRSGHRVVLAAGIVGPSGGAPRCRAHKRALAGSLGGGSLPAPAGLTGARLSPSRVKLTWRPVAGARGYRVLRDGVLLSQIPRPEFKVTLKVKKRTYRFSIATVDPTGKPGPLSRPVALTPGHRPPAIPTRPVLTTASENSLQLMWKPVKAGSAPVHAYRVLRDGAIVGQVAKPTITLKRLFIDRTYRVQVAAIDKRGYLSKYSPVLLARTSTPVQSKGGVRLFLLSSTDSSFDAFQRNYQNVSTIYPTYYDCHTSSGALLGKDDPRITRWAMARGVKVQPRYNCQSPGMVHKLATDPVRRQALAATLVGLTEAHGYDGINLDLEQGAPEDRDGYSALVAEVAAALHARGKHLSVDVSPKLSDVPGHPRSTFYDYNAIALHADEVIVMSWGLHWTTSKPGSIVDIRWYTGVYDYISTLPNRHKFLVGAPLYSLDWAGGGGPGNPATALNWTALQALIARTGAVPIYDAATHEWHFNYTDAAGVPHEVWFSTAATLDARLALAASRGLAGIALWRSGQEDPALWTAPAILAATP